MALQPVRRTAEEYRYLRGGLLPRLFTLTLAGGYSLLRLLRPHGRLPVRKRGALCCPDFPLLSMRRAATEPPRHAVAKVILFRLLFRISVLWLVVSSVHAAVRGKRHLPERRFGAGCGGRGGVIGVFPFVFVSCLFPEGQYLLRQDSGRGALSLRRSRRRGGGRPGEAVRVKI